MGQGVSCSRSSYEHEFFTAVQSGDLELVELAIRRDPEMMFLATVYDRLSALHIAAANGCVEVLSMILDQSGNPDLLNRHKQTPLMLAAMHGKVACVHKLLQAGANILMFDSLHGRTCLHYAAYYGHSDCLQVILAAARSSPVTDSWGFARFVNVRDDTGATPLHLAARHRRANCVHILLENGALSCASTGGYGFPGSTPLHFAARGGCLDCVRELLMWGADRLQRDSSGRIPYMIALKRKHRTCATLLNPSSPGPLVWPSPLKFISELDPEAKLLLEAALMEANREREKSILKGAAYSVQSPIHSEAGTDDNVSETSDSELCCICFDQVCTIEVQACGHQMCAHCILSLCCHNKPDPTTLYVPAPLCPFCRSDIARLVIIKTKTLEDGETDTPSRSRRSRRSRNLSEGSNSFKGLSTLGSFTMMTGRGSGLKANSSDTTDKP